MVNKITKEQRSTIMKSIKSQSKLEDRVSKALWKSGIRFRKNDKTLIGKPDISIKKHKLVIFIDSCFWHSCPEHGHMPVSNIEYWKKKLKRNVERDKFVSGYYIEKGWHLIRVWEHDLNKKNFNKTIEDLVVLINRIKKTKMDNAVK